MPTLADRSTIITGAGSSAYAAAAIAAATNGSTAIPTTDLLTARRDAIERRAPGFSEAGVLLSVARSGNSPESLAVAERLQQLFPTLLNMAITCNREGQLARMEDGQAIVLDPKTNDRSLVMTSSFSNLTLAGLALQHGRELARAVPGICQYAVKLLPQLQQTAEELAGSEIERVLVLASGPLLPLAAEIALKLLEMSGGQIVAIVESYLGLRHGPMSFLREDSLVLCVASSDSLTRRYEEDLLNELRQKRLGRVVAIATEEFAAGSVDRHVEPIAPELPDSLRTPFEVVFGQLLAYHLSLRLGLDPDQPSPSGVITRVVQKFRIHRDDE